MTLNELKAISNDRKATEAALVFDDIPMSSGSVKNSGVAERVTAFYDKSKADITPDDVVITAATTGANALMFQALLSPGDHVVATFPVYDPIVKIPQAIGAKVEFLLLEEKNGWQIDVQILKSMLKSSTKMLILNNPHNPTGTAMPTSTQEEIVELAKERNIIIFCDEIFRPLWHADEKPLSMIEHSSTYDRILVTGSLSKAWGFAGVRIGWIVTQNAEFRKRILTMRDWLVDEVSEADKVIAKEVLSERCSRNILDKNLGYAKENLKTLREMVERYKWLISVSIPTAGATAFVRFSKPSTNGAAGGPVDDVEFCERLLEETGLILAPASLTFTAPGMEESVKGYTRLHITIPPENFQKAMKALGTFLDSRKS